MLRTIIIAAIMNGTAFQASSEGTEDGQPILIPVEKVHDFMLSAGCMELGNLRLNMTHRGPWRPWMDGMPPEFMEAVETLSMFLNELDIEMEDVIVIRLDGKYLYKSEAPPEVWEYFMKKTQFTIDPKHFAYVYESVCAPSYNDGVYEPEIVKEAIVVAREWLQSQEN